VDEMEGVDYIASQEKLEEEIVHKQVVNPTDDEGPEVEVEHNVYSSNLGGVPVVDVSTGDSPQLSGTQ
ncbi:hypothetical protein A2U01_0103336, partial [Trifolium medium]|nr:hypothetical protein [Trifolium medium]